MAETALKTNLSQPASRSGRRMCSVCAKHPQNRTIPLKAFTLADNWSLNWYDSIQAAGNAWSNLAASADFFLSKDYFQFLSQLDLGDVQPAFAIFHHPDKGHFGVTLQAFTFDAEKQLGKLEETDKATWQRIKTYGKKALAKTLRFRILTAGQLLLTGHHGLRGQHTLNQEQLTQVLLEGLEGVARQWPERIHGISLKDFPLGSFPAKHRYVTMPVQPNMVLDLRPQWLSFDDYLDTMSSKYRVRARRARKKGEEITRKELSLAEVQHLQPRMYQLYKSIADTADFNAIELPSNYFTQWMEHFAGRFRLWGYFLGEQLIGFNTAIYNDRELDAHFLGFDTSFNHSHQLYLNMLYDLVHEGIQARVNRVVFCRTALEIKSSVGAVPETLDVWMGTNRKIIRPLIPIIAPLISPLPAWEARHPFKD
ncbi:MAG: GNAT family N-acetyltransferase [Saprospiraceae bacterium]